MGTFASQKNSARQKQGRCLDYFEFLLPPGNTLQPVSGRPGWVRCHAGEARYYSMLLEFWRRCFRCMLGRPGAEPGKALVVEVG